MKKTLPLVFGLCLCGAAARGADLPPTPQQTILWSIFIPGGGYFRQGDWKTGSALAASEAGLVVWGYNQGPGLSDGELNAPYIYALQIHNMSVYTAYRKSRNTWSDLGYKYRTPVDPAPAAEQLTAPFRWRYLSSPWVYGVALAGAGINFAAARADKNRRPYKSITDARVQGHSYDRREGTWAFHGYWIPISLGAGASEEMVFRGVFLPEGEEVMSPWGANVWQAAFFGLAHLDHPRDAGTQANAAFAFLAGLYFGWRTQRNDYRLSETIAAHTWFDIMAGTTLWLANPKENPLGVKVNFAL